MDFETAIYLTAILEVVTLICFFVLCSNVSNIKNKISKNGITSSTMFALYIGMGEKEKSKISTNGNDFSRYYRTEFSHR